MPRMSAGTGSAWNKHLLALVLVLVVGASEARVRVAESYGEDSNKERSTNKFTLPSIDSLDDPRLVNPWAALPDLHAKRKLQFLDEEAEAEAETNEQADDAEEATTTTTSTSWDVIVVGAGPGGIAAAKTILEAKPDTSVLIVERGPPLQKYKDNGYDDALQYNAATSDPEFRDDVAETPIVVGRGVGGGTLHFGMQFIDQDAVVDASERQPNVTGADLRRDVQAFANMTGATSYADEDFFAVSDVVGTTYGSLIGEIQTNTDLLQGKLYRNKVYKTGTDIQDQPRLLLGDLLDNTTVEIRTGVEVLQLLAKGDGGATESNGVIVQLANGKQDTWFADHIILAAGALNSARLALNDNIAEPTGTSADGRPFVGPVWDHHGFVATYWAPGTTFTSASASSSGVPAEYSVDLGLAVFSDIEDARTDETGFLCSLTIPALTSQQDVDSLQAGSWSGSDPEGADPYTYIFDLGNFFTSRHPAGDKTAVIERNNNDIGFVLDSFAPESHKANKVARLMRSGGRLLGILSQEESSTTDNDNTNTNTTIEFDYTTVDLAGDRIIGHLQTRPDDMDWQYYYVTAAGSNMIIGVSTTGELIEGDGRVYAGDSLGPDTVDLPSLNQEGFEAIMEGIKANHEILTNLGYFTQVDIQAITDVETLKTTPGYLPSTYHYHGTLSQTTLAPGFYAGDLSRMKSKWAGSSSVAAGAMGIQAGNEVLCELDVSFCLLSDESGTTASASKTDGSP